MQYRLADIYRRLGLTSDSRLTINYLDDGDIRFIRNSNTHYQITQRHTQEDNCCIPCLYSLKSTIINIVYCPNQQLLPIYTVPNQQLSPVYTVSNQQLSPLYTAQINNYYQSILSQINNYY